MMPASMLLFQTTETQFNLPTYFAPLVVVLFFGGLVVWLGAAAFGFIRAREAGSSSRWFALNAVCMIIYHVQFALAGLVFVKDNQALAAKLFASLGLFIVLGAVCSIIGFTQIRKN